MIGSSFISCDIKDFLVSDYCLLLTFVFLIGFPKVRKMTINASFPLAGGGPEESVLALGPTSKQGKGRRLLPDPLVFKFPHSRS